MFSTTTIPLSTSIPKANTKENSTIVFRVMPIALKMKKLINIDSGMAIPTKRALRNPKKNIKTNTTSNIPKMIEFSRSAT